MSRTLPAHTLPTVRSQLAAGMVAAVGAAAFTTAPADTAGAPSSTPVTLAAWQNPIVALLDSGEMAENYVFGGYYNVGEGAGEENWPAAGFDQAGGDLLNVLLTQEPALGNYFDVGFLPNFAAEAYLPAVQQLQINVEDYISVVLSGLNRAARDLATGVWDLPVAVATAVQLALQGQFSEALTAITDAVIGPIISAGDTVVSAATYVLSNMVARAGAVVAALPQILTSFAGTAIGGTSVLVQKTAAIVTGVVGSLATLNVEGAWNTAVDGLLGPPGIPGTLLNLITGAGVQTGPIVNPATDIPGNFVPSVRTSLQAAQWTIRSALETTSAATAAAVAAPRANRIVKPAADGVGEKSAASEGSTTVDGARASSPDRRDTARSHAGRATTDRARR